MRQAKQKIEALLMASSRPLNVDILKKSLNDNEAITADEIRQILTELADDCKDRGIELKQVASGYRYQTREEFSFWISRLWEERPPKYSRSLLETLALIVYRQPITRGEIEEVRGVAVNTRGINLMEEKGWIKITGYKEAPGRPALYGTTKAFLDYFGLRSLDELPDLIDYEKAVRLHPELNLGDVLDKEAKNDNNKNQLHLSGTDFS